MNIGTFAVISAAYPGLVNAQAKMEDLYARASALGLDKEIVRELIATEQRRTETSLNPFNWEKVSNQIDSRAGIFG